MASITAGTNISITGTASVPIVNLQNPLTATLNLGTQNCQGTSSQITLTNGGSQANATATLGFTSVVSATPTTKANLFHTSISVETSANKVIIQPSSILKSVGATTFSIGSVGSAPVNLIGAGGAADGVSITQLPNVGTVLTTSLSNVKYYPDTVLTNQDLSVVSVPLPQVDYQRLTLTNLGLTNTNAWNDYGNQVFGGVGYSAFGVDANGNIWLASTSGLLEVWNSTITAQLYVITLLYGGNPATINVLYSQGGYIFIGGVFDSINGNATAQNSITRVSTSTYIEDPMEDSATLNKGFQIGSQVYCMTDVNGALVCGGTFTTDSLGTTAIQRIGSIANPYAVSGTQVWTEYANGVDNSVYAIYHTAFLNYTFVGGAFTIVNVSAGAIGYAYCSYYDNGLATWGQVALGNINAPVYIIKPSFNGNILIAGAFSQIAGTGQDYNSYIEEATPTNWYDTTLSLGGLIPSYKQGYWTGENALIGFDNTFYRSSAYQVWTSLGQTGAGIITGINNWNGDWKVIGDSYGYVRSHSILPHSCEFQGSFVYDATAYTKYTITTRNVSQQFIGDIDNTFWSIIGQGVGAFS